MHSLAFPALNVGILIAILVYYGRKPIANFVAQRYVSLGEELQRVRSQLAESQAKFDEFTAKLKAVEAEVSAIRSQAQQDAQAGKTKIVSEARRLSTTLLNDARLSADGLYSDLKSQLSSELGGRVLERAEKILRERLTGDDRARIRQEFSRQVESIQ